MKRLLAASAFALGWVLPGLVNAVAETRHDRYQRQLLAEALQGADRTLCAGVGAVGTAAYNMCHVTRLFVRDINRGQVQGFPPATNTRYARSSAEADLIYDEMIRQLGPG